MSLALHYWMKYVHHCSGPPVSEITYTVSSGTLNSTIPLCLRRVVFPTFDFINVVTLLSLRDNWLQKCRNLENRVRVRQGHWKCHRSIERIWLPIDVSMLCRFWDIQCRKMSWPWNRGQISLKVIRTDTYRSANYDFLLTFHSNHGHIWHRFQDRRWLQSKIAKFSHPRVFCVPADGVPFGIGYRHRGPKTRMMGLLEGQRSLKIEIAV